MRTDKSARSRRTRGRLSLGASLALALAVFGTIMIPGGSAATTIKPYTANVCDAAQLTVDGYGETICPAPSTPPALSGGSAVVDVTFHNEASSQSLGSANISLPTGPSLSYDTASPAQIVAPATGDVTTSSNLVTLRNLNLGPDHSVAVRLTLNTPQCTAGTYDWSGAGIIQVKQSNDFNGPPGNSFTRVSPSSLTATLSGSCHLEVVSGRQPKDTVKNNPISDALYSSGGAVQVGLYDSAERLVNVGGSCPSGPGCVTASFAGGDPGATLSGTKSEPLVGGIASFGDLSLDRGSSVPYQLAFASSEAGVAGTISTGFAITDFGTTCTAGEQCSLPGTFSGTGGSSTTTTNVSTNFTTDGGLSLTFYTAGLPGDVVGSNGGCANFVPTTSAGVTLNITGTTGATLIDYGISDKALKKRYGPNYGQPSVPICIGAQRVDSSGTPIPCGQDELGGWTGKELGLDGKLDGNFKVAVCDPSTQLWWGIAPNFQDSPPSSFPPLSILISSWGSSTAPDGTSLRDFLITKPNPWDYTMQG
jgi:hypothetical protein